jgi:nucleoside-diphosphate-sugar epimerase
MNTEGIVASEEHVLVTEASGFIGTKLVEMVLERGFRNLRCFIRRSSRLCPLPEGD